MEPIIAIFAAGNYLKGLHIDRTTVLSVQLDAAFLRNHLVTVRLKQLHMSLALPVHPEIRARVH